jgi:uncharacterized protein
MPRHLLKKLSPSVHRLQQLRILRVFGSHVADPKLWTLHRRGVTAAFGAGLAICFIPLPVHMPVAALVAMTWRINIPTIMATIYVVNPLTMVPIYYVAYRIGAVLSGSPVHRFGFRLSWDWLQHGLGPMWKPFLTGCLACSMVCGVGGWLALELVWRWYVLHRRYNRVPRPASTA